MLTNAIALCEAKFGIPVSIARETRSAPLRCMASPAAVCREQTARTRYGHAAPGTALERALATKEAVQVADMQSEPAYRIDPAQRAGFRACWRAHVLGVPMLKENELLGAITIYRQEVRPFTDKQIELVTEFRRPGRDRHREHAPAQRAAGIAAAADRHRRCAQGHQPLDLRSARRVLNTLVESAAQLCEADMAALARPKGSIYRYEAMFGHSREHEAFLSAHPAGIDRGTAVGRTLVEGKIVHITDVLADPEYTYFEGQKLGGFRTLLGVPLLREGTPIGVLIVQRKTVRPFTEKQIELVTTFADQAVIAIENVRLFDEVQARTRELSEALGAANRDLGGAPGHLQLARRA